MGFRPEILMVICVMFCSAVWLSWLAGSPLAAKLHSGPHHSFALSQADLPAKADTTKPLDACSLLTARDIAAILGEPLQELKPSTHAAGKMNMSQCVFVTQNFAKSASLSVATPGINDSGARNLRAFWHHQFHSPRQKEQEEERRPGSVSNIPAKSAFSASHQVPETDEASLHSTVTNALDSETEDSARTPRPVSALGEEAFWVGSPLSGALYVLQGDLFLRISVGGVPKESARIAKSKSLATTILSRLHQSPH